MDYIITSLFVGVVSAWISIGFRIYEISVEKILVGKQFLMQIVFFVFSTYMIGLYFSDYSLGVGELSINWFIVFLLLSSLSYYMLQVLFEWKIKIPLFPTEKEIQEYLEKNT